MKSNQRLRFIAVASLAIAGASFTYADDRPTSGSITADRPAASDARSGTLSGTNAQDRSDTQAISQTVGKTVDAALSGDIRQLSQNFDRSSQRRFEDATKDQRQQNNSNLQQVSMELKRNFRDKYHKDIALADASQAFGSDFLRSTSSSSASDLNDRARTAGSRTEGTSNTNTSSGNTTGTGTTGTGTTGTTPNIGDGTTGPRGSGSAGAPRTITSNSGTSGNGSPGSSDNNTGVGTNARTQDMAASQTVSIPASHGLPEVRVPLVKDGADFKINVPSTLTAERLQANLARELARANDMKAQWPDDATQAERALAHHIMLAVMDQDSSKQTDRDHGADNQRDNRSDRTTSGDRNSSTDRNTTSGSK
jgi:hypothetical protein